MSKGNRGNISSEFATTLWLWRAQVLEKFKGLPGHWFVIDFLFYHCHKLEVQEHSVFCIMLEMSRASKVRD